MQLRTNDVKVCKRMYNTTVRVTQDNELPSAYLTPVSISALSAVFASSKRLVSYSFNFPIGRTFLTPVGPNTTFCAKYGRSVTSDLQYAHSTGDRPVSPASTALPKRAPAYAIDNVALPLPPLALTTSVPASCTCLSKSGILSASIVRATRSWEKTGMIV